MIFGLYLFLYNFNCVYASVNMYMYLYTFLIISSNVISILLRFGLSFLFVGNLLSECDVYGAGMFNVLSNRIGEVALLIVIALIINFGSWSFVYYLEFLSGSAEIEVISFLVLAAMTNSAQIPFSWLPAAIASPMPVSALAHSSTLVTAAVYLLICFSRSFSYWLNVILLLVSALTIFIAGLGANFEFGLKSIIALSTLSHLRLMIITTSIGLAGLAFFHLLTYAMFKALLCHL